jgi:ketosteroid isomerase-like protein
MNQRELCTRVAIQDLTNRYSLYVDTKQLDALLDLFCADAIFDESVLGAGPFHGLTEIRTYFENALPLVSQLMHVTSNLVLDIESADKVQGTSTLLFEGIDSNGAPQRLKGFFHDHFRPVAGRWKFKSRTLRLLE